MNWSRHEFCGFLGSGNDLAFDPGTEYLVLDLQKFVLSNELRVNQASNKKENWM